MKKTNARPAPAAAPAESPAAGASVAGASTETPAAEPKREAAVAPRARRAAPAKAKSARKPTAKRKAPKAQESAAPRAGTKAAQVVALLQCKNGATLEEIMEKMGWLAHTTRGFMAGAMKKAGYTVESFKSDRGARTYRINQ